MIKKFEFQPSGLGTKETELFINNKKLRFQLLYLSKSNSQSILTEFKNQLYNDWIIFNFSDP